MRILQLCPLWYPIDDNAPGGIETFLPRLIASLTDLGCSVTALASGDSKVCGELIPVVPRSLTDMMHTRQAGEYAYYEQELVSLAMRLGDRFDIIHAHIGPPALCLSSIPALRRRVVHTLHTPVLSDMVWFAQQHPDLSITTVSAFQARKFSQQQMANVHVVHNGICVEQFTFNPTGGGGMVYLGRIEPVKGTATAIRVAREIGMPLTIAGPIIDRGYFDAEVQPHLSGQIQYVGKVNHREKNELLGNATCLIAPFKGEEPFGLVSIEAMACGTPVAALPNGALPEIITDGVTGYLAPNEALLASAVQRAASLDRRQVRRHVAERFNIRVAAERYLHVFRHIVAADAAEHPSPS